MDDLKKQEIAKSVFEGICSCFDASDIRYDKNAEELKIEIGIRGEDFPIDINLVVDAKRCLVLLFSRLSVKVPDDKRLDLAMAVSSVNDQLVHGGFDYDIQEGRIYFRITNSYVDSNIDNGVYIHLLRCVASVVHNYIDKFMMLSKGYMDLEKFLLGENS